MSGDEPDRNDDGILKGRLALALGSERAAECRNKACARKRHCLARMGEDFNCFKPTGDCPNLKRTNKLFAIPFVSNVLVRSYKSGSILN